MNDHEAFVLREARLPLLAAVMAGFGAVISEVGAALMVGGNIKGETRVLTTATVLDSAEAVQRLRTGDGRAAKSAGCRQEKTSRPKSHANGAAVRTSAAPPRPRPQRQSCLDWDPGCRAHPGSGS